MNIKPGDVIKSKWTGKAFRFTHEVDGILHFSVCNRDSGSFVLPNTIKFRMDTLERKLKTGEYKKIGDW